MSTSTYSTYQYPSQLIRHVRQKCVRPKHESGSLTDRSAELARHPESVSGLPQELYSRAIAPAKVSESSYISKRKTASMYGSTDLHLDIKGSSCSQQCRHWSACELGHRDCIEQWVRIWIYVAIFINPCLELTQ